MRYALAAIRTWCRGFSEVVVVTPRTGAAAVRRSVGDGVRLEVGPDHRDDYLGQQVSKLYADRLTDAELICHVDSDMLFFRPVTPADLLVDGRPWIVRRPVTELGRHRPWLAPTQDFLGHQVSFDFMQHPPFTYPRALYGELRALCADRHGIPLDRYVASRPPRGFSEFNALGAYAHAAHRASFTWYDASSGAAPELCHWYWSRAGIGTRLREELDRVVTGPVGVTEWWTPTAAGSVAAAPSHDSGERYPQWNRHS